MSAKRKFFLNTTQSKEFAINFIKNIGIPSNFEVVIQKARKSQTDDQREGFHVLLKILAEGLGYSQSQKELEGLKQALKEEALGFETVTVFGKQYKILKSTTKYNRDDYSRLIETIYRIGSEMGVVLPNLEKR